MKVLSRTSLILLFPSGPLVHGRIVGTTVTRNATVNEIISSRSSDSTRSRERLGASVDNAESLNTTIGDEHELEGISNPKHTDIFSDGMPSLRGPSVMSRQLLICKNWCPGNSKPWSKKCNWLNCEGCSECNPPPENYADNFASGSYGGNTGSLNWIGSWTSSTGVWITQMSNWCKSGYCLRLITDYNSNVKSERRADLSGASSAYVTFDHKATLAQGGSATVEVSSDGNNFVVLGNIPGNGQEGSAFYTIPPSYFTGSFRVRFRASGSGWNDVYIDNVSVDLFSSGAPAPVPAPIPAPVPAPIPAPVPAPVPAQNFNYADNFDAANGGSSGNSGNDGNLDWATSWTSGTGVWISQMSNWCESGYCLRLITDYSSNVQSERRADLSGATSAQVTFDYKATFDQGGSASVEVSSDGNNFVVLGNIPGNSQAGSASYTIPPSYFTSSFRIRFRASGSGWNDVYIDNISIDLNSISGPTPPAPTPSSPTPPAPTPASPTPPSPTPQSPSQFSSGCGKSAQEGEYYITITSSNSARKYYISVPSNYDANFGYFLVFGYHGIGWSGDIMQPYLRLEGTSMASQAIFVYPDAEYLYWPEWGGSSSTGWRTGQRSNNEDFIFFDDILDDVANNHCIDLSRVYVTGQSWGGDMSSSLPCARGNKIAASVSVASNEALFFKGFPGYMHLYPAIQPQDCDRPVPMMTMHGRRDTPYEAWEPANWWYDINQCSFPGGGYFDKININTPGTYTDTGCSAPNIYVLYDNSGATQHWTDDHNIPQNYEDVAMNFFLQHVLP